MWLRGSLAVALFGTLLPPVPGIGLALAVSPAFAFRGPPPDVGALGLDAGLVTRVEDR